MGIVKKLTGDQLLERLEELFGENVHSFAHCEYGEIDTEELGFSYDDAKAEAVGKIKYDYYESIKDNLPEDYTEKRNHPDFLKYQEMPGKYNEYDRQLLEFLGLGNIVEVEQKGGMDEGSDWYSIKHFVDQDLYVKTQGWYVSHYGCEFENGIGDIVTPKSKVITVYEK